MKKNKLHTWKNIQLNIYNYGITKVASFGNTQHDAIKCMRFLNDEFFSTYGEVPENIFYFLSYRKGNETKYFIDFSANNIKFSYTNDAKYMAKIDAMNAKIAATLAPIEIEDMSNEQSYFRNNTQHGYIQ